MTEVTRLYNICQICLSLGDHVITELPLRSMVAERLPGALQLV